VQLYDFMHRYVGSRDVSDGYVVQMSYAIKSLEQFAGRTLDTQDFTVDLLNAFLRSTRDTLSAETRRHRRGLLLTLWSHAADDNLAPPPRPRKVMPIRVPQKLHSAWTPQQVRQLLLAADRLEGRVFQNGVSQRWYWRSYILAAWDSGLRGCDLRRIRQEDVGGNGLVVLIQRKTGKRVQSLLRAGTLEAIGQSFPPQRETIWGEWSRIAVWRHHAKTLVTRAGLTGSIGRLRHSSGTAVELAHPGRGHEHLGNTRRIFEQNYLDMQQAFQAKPMPERLV